MFAYFDGFGVIDPDIGLEDIVRPAATIRTVLSDKGFLVDQFEFCAIGNEFLTSGDRFFFVCRVGLAMGMNSKEQENAEE